jgi:hypothetical protein
MFEYGTKSDAERARSGGAIYRRGCAALLFVAGICLLASGRHGTARGVLMLISAIGLGIAELVRARGTTP